jgi:hypothetical protein
VCDHHPNRPQLDATQKDICPYITTVK